MKVVAEILRLKKKGKENGSRIEMFCDWAMNRPKLPKVFKLVNIINLHLGLGYMVIALIIKYKIISYYTF
jgi:hypothetical protein